MKIAATRRGFLAFLGAAPVAPIVAKAAVEKEVASLAGVTLGGAGSNAIGLPYSGIMDSGQASGGIDVMDAAQMFMSTFGVPEHVRDNLARRSRAVHTIDPDIAVKRSWSFAVKIQAQRERNLATMEKGMLDGIAQTQREKAFRKLSGFSWPFYY